MDELGNESISELIPRYQGLFRILEKWNIQYDETEDYRDQCSHNSKMRKAWIYPVSVPTDLDDYVLHEILHICQCELRNGGYKSKREKEELFVQDLCKIYRHL